MDDENNSIGDIELTESRITYRNGHENREEKQVDALPNGKEEIKEFKAAPLDGGWGWFIVLACMIMHGLVGGLNRTYGIIYIQLRKRFNSSAAITAWVGGLTTAIRMGTSPVSTTLANIFTFRKVALVGGILFSLAYIISAFAPSIEFMFFSYSILAGFGGCFIYAPCMVMVGKYFDKRRGIATGMATAGSGFGVLSLPPIMEIIFNVYGYFGGMLILSAIAANLTIAASLLRPLEANYPKCEVKEGPVIKKKPKNDLKKYVDCSMCNDVRFVTFACSLGVITAAYNAGQMLVPDLAKSKGALEKDAVLLISIMAIGDTLSRFGSGFLFDIPVIRKHRKHWYNLAILVSGLTCYMWAFSWNYAMIATTSVIHGLFNGCVVSQRAVVLADLVGTERLPNSFALTVSAQGLCLMVGPMLSGYLRDVTGDYTWSFIFNGTLNTLAAFSFLAISFMPVYKTREDDS